GIAANAADLLCSNLNTMLTDSPPFESKTRRLTHSDRIPALTLAPPAEFVMLTQSIEAAMKTGKAQDVLLGCEQFLQSLSRFHEVSPCGVRGLASRPLAFARTGQVNFSTITILPPWPSGSGCVPR